MPVIVLEQDADDIALGRAVESGAELAARRVPHRQRLTAAAARTPYAGTRRTAVLRPRSQIRHCRHGEAKAGTAHGEHGREGVEKKSGLRIPGFAQLQRLGKSLMLPIALLPAAGILLRLGQPDLLGGIDAPVIGPFFEAMSAAGGAIFANLPLLFADRRGHRFRQEGRRLDRAGRGRRVPGDRGGLQVDVAGRPGRACSTPAGEQAQINYSVFAGILVGLVTAVLFDRYHTIQLPSYLGFFGGRRFVPIVVSVACLIIGFALSYFYPIFDAGLTAVGRVHRRRRRVRRLHLRLRQPDAHPDRPAPHPEHLRLVHLRRLPDARTATVVTGELTRFAAGDTTAGLLTSGFYPILMFGLPAAALAMIHMAEPEAEEDRLRHPRRRPAITAFLTGVTEPLEFAFMFVAFPLYVVHAVLTGLSLAIAYLLDIHLGFSFSAGLIDLLLYGTAPAAKNVSLLLVMGVVFFARLLRAVPPGDHVVEPADPGPRAGGRVRGRAGRQPDRRRRGAPALRRRRRRRGWPRRRRWPRTPRPSS